MSRKSLPDFRGRNAGFCRTNLSHNLSQKWAGNPLHERERGVNPVHQLARRIRVDGRVLTSVFGFEAPRPATITGSMRCRVGVAAQTLQLHGMHRTLQLQS
jgi:hypothetical protein